MSHYLKKFGGIVWIPSKLKEFVNYLFKLTIMYIKQVFFFFFNTLINFLPFQFLVIFLYYLIIKLLIVLILWQNFIINSCWKQFILQFNIKLILAIN